MAKKELDKPDETGTEVVSWEERLATEAKDAAAVERPQIANISMRAGVMTYQMQPLPGNKLQCVVAAAIFENRYYEGPWDPNNIESPSCFALSMGGEHMRPSEKSKNRQNSACEGCDRAQWKTIEGRRRKECGEIRRLMLLPVTDLTAEAITKTEAAMLKVSVTNVKHWSNYVNSISVTYKRPAWALITEISATPDARTQFRISFETISIISDGDILSAIANRKDALAQIAMTPYDGNSSKETAEPKEDTKY